MIDTSRKCTSCGYPDTLMAGKCVRCGTPLTSASASSVSDGADIVTTQPSTPERVETLPVNAPMCFNHPTLEASAKCDYCAMRICIGCDFVLPAPPASNAVLGIGRNTHLCPSCVAVRRAARPGAPMASAAPRPELVPLPLQPLVGGVTCVQHRDVPALRRCDVCTGAMCATCDFQLPGHFHVCPTCATNPQKGLSSRRKTLVGIAYGLAGWSTLGFAILFSGAINDMITTKEQEAVADIIVAALIFVPTLAGMALSFSALDKRLGNPPTVYAAVIWNSVLLAVWVLLRVLGSFS